MAVDAILISCGCPRSGTTWMRQVLGEVKGAFVTKLAENNALHPCQSKDGLLSLAHMLHKERLVIVRTVRHPLEIAESFAATRTGRLRMKAGNLAKNSHQKVVEWIRSESEGTRAQRGKMPTGSRRHLSLAEVHYESLAESAGRKVFVDSLSDVLRVRDQERLLAALESFGKKPARVGRLSEGLGAVLTEEERAWYREQLADVIAREGYDAT